jgi:hydroxyacylglutathione hydrolase
MAPINRAGPVPVDLSRPTPAGPQELRCRLDTGAWLVDLRIRAAYAQGHLPGSVNIGLDGAMSTYLGWLLPWRTPVTLLGDTPEQVAQAQRELVRIGIDRPAAAATGDPASWADGQLGRYPIAGFAALPEARAGHDVTVLDVRRGEEWRESHLDGARHIPLDELPARQTEVPPPPTETWVHCETGYRSAIAASLLAGAGRRVVLIDDQYTTAQDLGWTASPPRPVAVTG